MFICPASTGRPENRTVDSGIKKAFLAIAAGAQLWIGSGQAAEPVLVTTYPTTGVTSTVMVEGRRAFLASGSAGFQIIDIGATGSVSQVGGLAGSLPSYPDLFCHLGTQLVYASDRVVYPVDISDPASPELVGHCLWHEALLGIAPLGNDLLLLGQSSLYVAGFWSPTVLRKLSERFEGGGVIAASLAIQDNTAFIAADRRLDVYDVSSHTHPKRLSRMVPSTAYITCIAVDGTRVCLGLDTRRVLFLDVSNPAQPVVVATNSVASSPYGMVLTGNRLVVVEGSSGFEIFNVENPTEPIRECAINTPGTASATAVCGPFLLVADGSAGLAVYQTDRPSPPRITKRPQSQLVHPGETAMFTVEADGWDTPTYQWLRNGAPITEDAQHQGTQSPTLVLSDVTEGDAAGYSVVVSCLGEGATTPPAQLTVSRLHTWGRSRYRSVQLDRTPPDESAIVSIAAGAFHDLALYTNGTVFAWGKNTDGQTNVPPSLTNAIAVAAGSDHSLALLRDGTLAAWGKNDHGQTNVPPEATNVVAIAAGWAHTLALRADGSLVAWGNNDYGQCFVHFLATDIKAIAAGYYHSLALRADGRVVSWGLGDAAPEWATNVVAIAGGFAHSLALAADGSVTAWGDDTYGQSTVPAAATNVVAISAGFYHSLALRADGTVVAWGKDVFGMVNQAAKCRDIALLDSGEDHSVALMAARQPALVAAPATVVASSGGLATFSVQARAGRASAFQWYRAGSPVSGATSATLSLRDLAANHAEEYSVELTGPGGPVRSEPTTLALVDLPPVIGAMPRALAAGEGTPVELGVTVAGSPPFSYQWLHDDLPVPGATNLLLELAQATLSDAGSYALVVSNTWGSARQGDTVLAVFPPTPSEEMELALDSTGLGWTTSPNSPWTLTTTNSADLVDALRCGPLTGDEESWVQTMVTGPATIDWQWNISVAVSTNTPVISLVLETATLPGPGGWIRVADLSRPLQPPWQSTMTTWVGAGTHLLRWTAYARSGTPTAKDRCFLDRVEIRPLLSLRAEPGTDGTRMTLSGPAGSACALERAATLGTTQAWETLQILTLPDGSAVAEIPRTTTPEAYYRLRSVP